MIFFQFISAFLKGLKPEPRLTVSQWADNNRVLDSKSAAEPGQYRTSRTPYLREIMDNLSVSSPYRKIIVQKGAQVGMTEVGNNFIGYIIDCAPAPIMSVMPTEDTAKRNSRIRIAPMIEKCKSLSEKVKASRSRDSGNTILQKEFPGGILVMTGANSGVGLRSMPVRFLILDEVDGYPLDVDGEGSPISLAEKRTTTFSSRKKIFELSTPTVKGTSIIEADFLKTDRRYYHVPCPFCGGMQILKFENLKWEVGQNDDASTKKIIWAKYKCEHCGDLIEERFKTKMFDDGVWIATAPENTSDETVGYHLSALYSPFGMKSWKEVAEEWEDSQNDDNKLKTFYNTVLGETWEEKTDAPEWQILYERAEDYPLNKPWAEVIFLTAGVDVQKDRIEIEIVGWMKGKRSQQIDYRVLEGDTDKPEVWQKLDSILNESWEREDGLQMQIRLMAVDSGWNTHAVYKFTKKYSTKRVVPVKGQESLQMIFAPPRTVDTSKYGKKIGKVKVWSIGSSYIKSEIYSWLRNSKNHETGETPEGYCHLPKRDTFYYRGITAEKIQLQKNKRNYIKHVWVKHYERNEPLDCRVYARAAASIVGIDIWSESRWNQEMSFSGVTSTVATKKKVQAPVQPTPIETKPKRIMKQKKSSFWNK